MRHLATRHLTGADLRGALINDHEEDRDREGTILTGAKLADADLRDADRIDAIFADGDDSKGADLRGAILSGALYDGADFRESACDAGADASVRVDVGSRHTYRVGAPSRTRRPLGDSPAARPLLGILDQLEAYHPHLPRQISLPVQLLPVGQEVRDASEAEQLKLVSEMLGHSSIKQTADTYTHVAPTIHRDAARRLDDFLRRHLDSEG